MAVEVESYANATAVQLPDPTFQMSELSSYNVTTGALPGLLPASNAFLTSSCLAASPVMSPLTIVAL